VAIFEKGVIAGEASGRSGGLVESQFLAPEKMQLVEYSKQRWRTLNALTQEDTTFMDRGGASTLFTSADGLDYAKGWIDSVKGLPNGGARMLSAAEASAMAPGATVKLTGGIISTTDATAESAFAAPAIALGARKHGAKIFQHCAVRGIERTNKAVSGVVTEKGRVAASSVVLAGGLWSPMLGNDLGLDLPLVQNFAHPTSLHPFPGPDFGVVTIMGEKIVGWRKQPDGGYLVWDFTGVAPIIPTALKHYFDLRPALAVLGDATAPRFNLKTFWRWRQRGPIPLDRPGPFEATRIYEPEFRAVASDTGFEQLQQAMPVFEAGSVRERWTGAMEMSVDNLPILSTVDAIRGLVVGTGCFYGLTMGPGAGLILADLAMGRTPAIDIKPFTYRRFVDGSKLRFHD
jgi:glycine/D-amino acid oxidase-like deaminating enzyme